MRRASLLLLLILLACRDKETDARLKKVEKELADMKANPPVETITVPAPAPAPAPAVSSPGVHEEHPLPEAGVENLFRLHLAAFVPTKDDEYAGCVLETHPGVVFLYRFVNGDYIPVTRVYEHVVSPDGKITVTDEQMGRLQDRLARNP